MSGRNVVRITILAHGVLNVSGRHCQTFSDLNPRVLLQLLLIPLSLFNEVGPLLDYPELKNKYSPEEAGTGS